jgi:P22 coat protein - gene protein 5
MSNMKQILLARSAPMIGHMPAYANDLTAIIGDIWTAMDVVSRELVGYVPSVMMAAGVTPAAVGQTVEYPIAPAQTASDIVPAMTPPSNNDNTFQIGTMQITKARAVKFNFLGEEQRSLNAGSGPNYLSAQGMIVAQGLRTLTNEVEGDLADTARRAASRAFGTPGTTPFGSAVDNLGDLAQIRKILDDNGAPATGRSFVMNTATGANLRSTKNLSRVNEAGDQMNLRQGELMDIFGMSLKETGQSRSQTKGTAAGATTNAAGYAIGATVITLASAGTGTIVQGDYATFAGDPNKYLVRTGDTDVSNGGTITLALPGLRQAIPAGATAITLSNSYAVAGVGFSQDAIHLAARPPARPQNGDLAIDVMMVTDPRSGLTFEFAIYPGYRMMYGEIGLAWGTHASKTEHIALLQG